MQVKKLLTRYKHILLTGMVIVLSLAGFLFGVIPLAQQTIRLWQSERVLTRDIAALTTKSALLQSLDESTLRSNLQTLTSAVPAEKSIGTIFATLDGVSGIDVAIKDFQITKLGSIATSSAKKLTADETKIGSSILPFSVTVTGSFDRIRTFLTSLTAVRRLFRLRSMDFSFTPFGTDARLNLDAFYFPYPKAVGAVAAPISALSDKEEATIAQISALPWVASAAVQTGSASAVQSAGKDDPFSP